MLDITARSTFRQQHAGPQTASDRRRPGRINDISSTLTNLLRSPVQDIATAAAADIKLAPAEKLNVPEREPDNALGAATGIFVSVILSLPLWVILISLVYTLSQAWSPSPTTAPQTKNAPALVFNFETPSSEPLDSSMSHRPTKEHGASAYDGRPSADCRDGTCTRHGGPPAWR